MPVGGTKDTFNIGARTFRHEARVQWNNNLKVLIVNQLVTETKLHSVCQRIHHVAAVVVQHENIRVRLQNWRDVGGEVSLCQRSFYRVYSFPAHSFS